MSAQYPGDIFDPRTKENKAGVTYDPTQTTKLYAEDVSYLDLEVVAIETELGIDPKGTFNDVVERLEDIDERITAITNPRVQSVTSASSVTPNADENDCVDITAQAEALSIVNPSGSPVNFQKLIIRIKDNATARAISYGTAYVAGGTALPSTTVVSKIMTLGFIYNTANSLNKWQLVAVAQQA